MPHRIREVWPDLAQAIGSELVDTLEATRQAGPGILTVTAALGVVLGAVWTPVTIAMLLLFVFVFVLDIVLDGLIAVRESVDAHFSGRSPSELRVAAKLAGSFIAKMILALVVPIVMAVDGLIVLGVPADDGIFADLIQLGLLTKGVIVALALVIAISSLQKIDRESGGKVPPITALLRIFARLRDAAPSPVADRPPPKDPPPP